MEQLGTVLVVVAVTVGSVAVFSLSRTSYLGVRLARSVAVGCLVALGVAIVGDVPGIGAFRRFYADHEFFSGIAGSLLLAGFVYFAWTFQDQRRQGVLATHVSAIGLGALVRHVAQVEAAVAMAQGCRTLDDAVGLGYTAEGKPLRWLRPVLGTQGDAADPRRLPMLPDLGDEPWRHDLVDQALRRLMAGMREWRDFIGTSADGTTVLLMLADVRLVFARSARTLQHDDLVAARQVLRLLTAFFEEASLSGGTERCRRDLWRSEVLTDWAPVGGLPRDHRWTTVGRNADAAKAFGPEWRAALTDAWDVLDRRS